MVSEVTSVKNYGGEPICHYDVNHFKIFYSPSDILPKSGSATEWPSRGGFRPRRMSMEEHQNNKIIVKSFDCLL